MRGVVLVALSLTLTHRSGVSARRHEWVHEYSKHPRAANLAEITPDQQNNTEVMAQVGSTATIKCYTHFLGDETVTWLKRDEDQLLTAGGQVYASEARYSVSHVRHQQLWELSVRDVRHSDAGMYECQLTTHPPTSLFFILKVVEARAVLQGAPEVHVQTGVSLRLHCAVQQATQAPEFIFWFHNDSMINYAPRRPLRVQKHHFSSTLLIADVKWDDAGSYRCEPHMASPANLTLHVVAGEKHAALHNGQGEGAGEEHSTADGPSHSTASLLITGACVLVVLLLTAHMDNLYGMEIMNGKNFDRLDDQGVGTLSLETPEATLCHLGNHHHQLDPLAPTLSLPGHQITPKGPPANASTFSLTDKHTAGSLRA
ncbi:uncharacterized protein [Procambarus clarkii]|uniref:uncharacterized protein n=1 Tax=Procambarus clarkii TaxID=6728 RepID=UPI0037429691